jgi:hypothetical protein
MLATFFQAVRAQMSQHCTDDVPAVAQVQ